MRDDEEVIKDEERVSCNDEDKEKSFSKKLAGGNVEVSILWEVCLLILLFKVVIEEEERVSCNDEEF